MQAYILDKNFKPTRVIDTFQSFIWNDVYIGYGDFEIQYAMTENTLAYIEVGYYVSIPQSEKIMIIESIEIVTSFTEGNVCRIAGRSLESILDYRILRKEVAVNGNLQEAISTMITENMISSDNPNRNIEGFVVQFSNDSRITNLELESVYEVGKNLYTTIHDICEERHIGFKITLHNERFFKFELYVGDDHSYNQETNPWVVFSSQFENLEDSDMKIDLLNHKNCMEIDYQTTENVIEPIGGNEETKVIVPLVLGDEKAGLDRREVYGSSNLEVDKIDIASFGTAESRVNMYDYMSWQVTGFDRTGYEAAMQKYHDTYDSRISDAQKPQSRTERYINTDHPYYDQLIGTSQEYLLVADRVVTETPSEAAARSASYVAAVESHRPNRSDYETWGWDFTSLSSRQAYYEAVSKAQAEINAQYSAAVNAAFNYAKACVTQSAAEELSDYQKITSFDGKIDPNINYLYGRDYGLGDIVQIVNAYHFNATTRVTSVLFSHDMQNGTIVRPTFESDDVSIVEFDISDSPLERR